MIARRLAPLAALLLGCAAPPRAHPDSAVDIAAARARGEQRGFTWEHWSADVFDRARRERRMILVDGSAEWCHWCHVMDETTYADAEIGRILRERFIAIRVDIDERPDLAERYGEWGWPATILLSPDAEEVGKYRGYLPPGELAPILTAASTTAPIGLDTIKDDPADRAPPVDALGWLCGRLIVDMDDYYDPKQGGWGFRQKTPIGVNVEVELLRFARGDKEAGARASFSLKQERALLDAIWGGVYQYSVGETWKDPHFEKLMPYQAAAIEAYARAGKALGDASFLEDARRIEGYLAHFLMRPDGAFYVSQDADVNAHELGAHFIDGHAFYAKDDSGRRAIGMPHVDDHVYALENGLAIAALTTLSEASGDKAPLDAARKAADAVIASHVGADGRVAHDASSTLPVRFLADAASLGRGLARLAEITGDARYRDMATRIAAAMLRDFADPESAALFGQTDDPAALGVFKRRDHPFEPNVTAARFLAALAKANGDTTLVDRAKRLLAGVATPRRLNEEGRFVGGILLALHEVGEL